jgi:hypothetical protein
MPRDRLSECAWHFAPALQMMDAVICTNSDFVQISGTTLQISALVVLIQAQHRSVGDKPTLNT